MSEALIAAGIGAAASLAGTAMANSSNTNLNNRNMVWQEDQTRKAQEYQNQQREAQNAYLTNLYKQYQSPQAMAQQYRDAGFNPALALDKGSVGSAQGASNGGAPIASSPSTIPFQGYNFGSNFQDMASAFNMLAQAKKTGVETSNLERIFGEQLKQIQLSNEAQKLINSVNMKYLDKQAQATLSNTLKDIALKDLTGDELRKKIDLLAKEGIEVI